MTFEEVMKFTRTVSSETALSDEEARVLYDIASQLEEDDHIVEIGCQFGRSTSLLAQVARERKLRLTCIDPFWEPREAALHWFAMMRELDCPFTLHYCESYCARIQIGQYIDLLYIDGNHDYKAVAGDCSGYLPIVNPGGYVCFHDYGRDSLPGVKQAADEWMKFFECTRVALAGTMAAWRVSK